MRRLFTLLLVALAVGAARATDYNVPMTVTVNGTSTEQTAVFTIEENAGLYDISLKNFVLESENGPMGVGNVELKGIESRRDGDAILFVANDRVTMTAGDDPNVAFWMASILPPVDVLLRGKIEGDRLRCYIDIDLTETLQQVIQVSIGEGYQVPNASFEAWHISSGANVEPNAWHSFESASGEMAGMVAITGTHIGMSDDYHSGTASARIFASSIFGIVANGTMTTGRMNAGAMDATSTANHAYLDMSMLDVDGNGDPFYVPLYSRPDSVAVWVKFKQGTPNSAHPYATISAVITDGTRYQDPEDKAYTNVVAKAINNKIAVTNGEWVRVTAPFVYTENAVDPKAVLITVSTNADAGQGSDGDEVLVDDIALIYNAKVNGLKVKGESVPGFSSEKSAYEMELNQEITADDIEVDVDGQMPHVLKTVEVDGDYYVCNVLVFSADMSVMSAYVVRVKSSATAIRSVEAVSRQPATYYTLDGRQVTSLMRGRVYICRQADGTVTKIRY